jgi:hypothetical protein
MKPAEKIPEGKPAASPPNPERRKFLRNILVAGALAPFACSKEPTETAERHTLFQNRSIRAGGTAIIFDSCNYGNEYPSAHFTIRKDGSQDVPRRESIIVPASFKFDEGRFEYELYADNVSCGAPQSADITLVRREAQSQDDGKRHPETSDLFTIGAAAALLASIFFAIFERKSHVPDEGLLLPPKRNH